MDTTKILIAFMIVLGVSLVTFAILFIVWLTKQRTVFRIIAPNKRTKRYVIRGSVPEKNTFGSGTYIYDSEAELTDFWGKQVYYFEGNPNPIIFDRKAQKVVTNARDLKHIIKNTIIEQLLASDTLTKILMVLSVIILIASIGGVIAQFIHTPACDLANSQANIEVISNAFKQALK